MTTNWSTRLPVYCVLAMLMISWAPGDALAQAKTAQAEIKDFPKYIREHYTKEEHRIPMRDGVRLFTAIYAPKDTSRRYPILMMRTPYSVRPYGKDQFARSLGPSKFSTGDGYIFVYQDVRGCYLSEGNFVDMRPHIDHKTRETDVDESSDTYDTIAWLAGQRAEPQRQGRAVGHLLSRLLRVGGHDRRPPGAEGRLAPGPHRRLVLRRFPPPRNALPAARLQLPRPSSANPDPSRPPARPPALQSPHARRLPVLPGPGAAQERQHTLLQEQGRLLEQIMVQHPNYDQFWQARNLLPHLKKVAPAVMTVGGWFDAEDLYGTLKTYRAIEDANPGIFNVLVMGPWRHGGWSRGSGDRLGNISFGSNTSEFFQENIERPFFEHYLKR